ncbi:MAG: hypothetical protein JOS17DRAFT_778201 [Linnemannia elongata]|nr:MAG: hypothetical protein JOS17DRAFT_778201 [Linnemannia elongata]
MPQAAEQKITKHTRITPTKQKGSGWPPKYPLKKRQQDIVTTLVTEEQLSHPDEGSMDKLSNKESGKLFMMGFMLEENYGTRMPSQEETSGDESFVGKIIEKTIDEAFKQQLIATGFTIKKLPKRYTPYDPLAATFPLTKHGVTVETDEE